MGAYLNREITKEDLRAILFKGLYSRQQNPNEMLERYPGARAKVVGPGWKNTGYKDKWVNRDQLTFLIPLMREAGMDHFADDLLKEYGGWLFPHQRDAFYGRNTWLGRIAESGDSIADWFSGDESSQVNNIARLAWGDFKGKGNKTATQLYRKKIDPWYALVVFGSRTPEMGAGKSEDEQRKIFDALFRVTIESGANEKSPAPIYQPWPVPLATFL